MTASLAPRRYAVYQDAARLHYAVPEALHRAHALERVFCDFYARPGSFSRLLARAIRLLRPALGQRMFDRYSPGLAGARIYSNLRLTLRVLRARKRFSSPASYFYWEAAQKVPWVLSRGFGNADALFGFIRNAHPDLFAAAKKMGLRTVGDQMIAPAAIEHAQDLSQCALFPDWTTSKTSPDADARLDQEIEERTWRELDLITCASPYVREGLISQGISESRILLNPYPVDPSHFPVSQRTRTSASPVRVGFVGAVNLRKGAPWFLKVAQAFDPVKVRFVMVGPVAVSDKAKALLGQHVELIGAVPRSTIPRWLTSFDLYFFPSTCEGSAQSVMEAMMTGLAVVASPNSGSLVRDGTDGRIVPYDDVPGAVQAIQGYVDQPEHRLAAGQAAAVHARSFSLDAYAKRLLEAPFPV